MTHNLALRLCEADGRTEQVDVAIDQVILIGYSGRNRATVESHIRELQELGIAPPPRIPAIYTVPAHLVTTGDLLRVNGVQTSGEAEFVLLPTDDGIVIGVGSDHTDRQREAVDVPESKAACGKVIGAEVWRFADVEAHWDSLELRAWTTDAHGRGLYQTGRVDELLAPKQLLSEVERAGLTTRRRLVFGGTLPTIGGFAYGNRFEVELSDPVLGRRLSCGYDVVLSSAATVARMPSDTERRGE
jgi:hypothetical protein